MYGRFEDQVAAKEPNKIARDYAVLMKKVRSTDYEQNRFVMTTDFATGCPMSAALRKM